MLDLAQNQTTRMQRVTGRAFVGFGARGLRDLHQSGSAKAILPKVHSDIPEVVFLNTAGGLTGGDRMQFSLEVDAGVSVVATTQTAERAYASSGGVAKLDVNLRVGNGGRIDWLPQETILFDNAALERRTQVDLVGDATFLFVETVVLGRAAMGETVQHLHFRDLRRVTRDGVPVMIEPLALGDDLLARRGGCVTLAGARAFSTIGLIGAGAEDALGLVREMLAMDGVQAAATAWDGKLIIRAMAADAFPLRRLNARVLMGLRDAPLPRVWQE